MPSILETESGVHADEVRAEARAWFEAMWDPDLTVGEWWNRLFEGRWTVPSWPRSCFGRGYSREFTRIVGEERSRVGAAPGPGGMGLLLAGPTLIAHGNAAQQHRLLPPLLRGQEGWCQLFSEPNAGSDLAGVQTRAVRADGGWRVTGQKLWSSGAQHADLGMLLARTDPEAPKHQRITWFVIEMDQPGIEIRPIREMTGRTLFNEVFLDGALVRDDGIVGDLHGGWPVARTTLAAERSGLGEGNEATSGVVAGRKGGMLDRRAGAVVEGRRDRSGTAVAMSGKVASRLLDLARQRGANTDPVMRQRLVQLWMLERISGYTAQRARHAARAGQEGPAPSVQKLQMSEIVRLGRDVGMSLLGPDATVIGPQSATGGVVQEMALFSPAPSIYGGTDEIQRNLLGERVLGLPREPR